MTPRKPDGAGRSTTGELPFARPLFERVIQSLKLSAQQAKIVELVLCGLRDKQISTRLNIGVPTVRTYLGRLYQRLEVQDRIELILHIVSVAERLRTSPPPS
jgi:DNA-binding NarL/FixJ family response regulator